jgi:PAS domain-containing protein
MDDEVTVKARQELEMPVLCRLVVDTSPMPMACVEGAAHIIRYVNAAFCDLAGKPKNDVVGKEFSAAVIAGDECLALFDRVSRTGQPETRTGEYWSYVMWPVLAADGRRVAIMMQATETASFHNQAIAVNQALVVASVHQHELTETAETLNVQLQAEMAQRKLAEEALRASEGQLRALLESASQGVVAVDESGRMVLVNAKTEEMFGYTRDELLGQSLEVMLPERFRTAHAEYLQH